MRKKPPQREVEARRVRLPLAPVRAQIWAAACELVGDGHADEVSATLANRFHTSERIIDMVLVLEGMKHERIAATLRTGMIAALEESRRAAASIDDDTAAA